MGRAAGILESFLTCHPSQPMEIFLCLSTARGVCFHCASPQHLKGKVIHQETPTWQLRLGTCRLACLGVKGKRESTLRKRSPRDLVLGKSWGSKRRCWIHSPTLIGTTILAFYSWAMTLQGKKCQSQGCTMQHCSKLRMGRNEDKMENALSRSQCVCPCTTAHGM